mmetsp:Transcript_81379/g.225346  ORF Transcript_81379/g.225346 Transcript_81379/m.225346 type:complete len:157 (-) Transcript_81379:131-601(-)
MDAFARLGRLQTAVACGWRRPIWPAGLPAAPQRRWRHHNGGVHGPQYHHFPTEVKVNEYPPKDRSELMKLPDSKRLMFVANGYYYPGGVRGRHNKAYTPVLTFASRHKHNHMDSLTAAEVAVFESLVPQIRAQFAECKKTAAAEAERDATLAHVCR